jgi:predicted nucleic acid-binding protein
MVLVDTSCWTHSLRRKGDEVIRAKVRVLLEAGEAAWCDVVRLELWNGAANDWDRELLRNLESEVSLLPMRPEVWEYAIVTASRARSSGLNVPATDLMIFACAKIHDVKLEHADRHFVLLENLK